MRVNRQQRTIPPVQGVRRFVQRALETRAVSSLSTGLTANHLRILGFHGVDDLRHFENLISMVLNSYTPVNGDAIKAALEGKASLPPRAVWFTFDDGLQSTMDAGSLLHEHGVVATAFVNPASIAEPHLLWFQIVEAALSAGVIMPDERERFSLLRLKNAPDQDRRAAVAILKSRLESSINLPATKSASIESLQKWVAFGHEVGNHTWDHPCLDTCSEGAQENQIRWAHDWLMSQGLEPRFFAYPNGNFTEHSADTVASLGYIGSVLFDHRLAKLNGSPHQLSRLRIDSSAPLPRVRSILSGAHSAVFSLTELRRR